VARVLTSLPKLTSLTICRLKPIFQSVRQVPSLLRRKMRPENFHSAAFNWRSLGKRACTKSPFAAFIGHSGFALELPRNMSIERT